MRSFLNQCPREYISCMLWPWSRPSEKQSTQGFRGAWSCSFTIVTWKYLLGVLLEMMSDWMMRTSRRPRWSLSIPLWKHCPVKHQTAVLRSLRLPASFQWQAMSWSERERERTDEQGHIAKSTNVSPQGHLHPDVLVGHPFSHIGVWIHRCLFEALDLLPGF